MASDGPVWLHPDDSIPNGLVGQNAFGQQQAQDIPGQMGMEINQAAAAPNDLPFGEVSPCLSSVASAYLVYGIVCCKGQFNHQPQSLRLRLLRLSIWHRICAIVWAH